MKTVEELRAALLEIKVLAAEDADYESDDGRDYHACNNYARIWGYAADALEDYS